MTSIRNLIDQLEAHAKEHGDDCPVGTFNKNELHGEVIARFINKEFTPRCGKMFSGIVITGSKR